MLTLTQLESRDNPANFIPGWDGGEQLAPLHVDSDPMAELAVVALDGGSCRVMVIDDDGQTVILNEIVFDPNFRGGGSIKTVSRGRNLMGADSLIVVPGTGGGPHVMQFDFDKSTGTLQQSFSFFAPYPESFRGGLKASGGDIDGDGIPEAMFLPVEGYPQLVAVDLHTHETEMNIYVGHPTVNDPPRFEPTGGTIYTPLGRIGIVLQYGDLDANLRVPTRIWSATGEDITDDLLYTGPILQTPE